MGTLGGGEVGMRLQLPAGPAGEVGTQVSESQQSSAGTERDTASEADRGEQTMARRLGGALMGAMRGIASRVGSVWGVMRARKRLREGEESEEESEKRRRTGDG